MKRRGSARFCGHPLFISVVFIWKTEHYIRSVVFVLLSPFRVLCAGRHACADPKNTRAEALGKFSPFPFLMMWGERLMCNSILCFVSTQRRQKGTRGS